MSRPRPRAGIDWSRGRGRADTIPEQYGTDSLPLAASDVQPAEDADPAEWASYCNAARGQAAAAIIQWGQRIAAAHRAYRAQPQRWGQTWADWCRDNLGIGDRSADRLRAIGENLRHTVSDILPADQQSLYSLAKLSQSQPEVFRQAIDQGEIRPAMKRAEVLALAARSSLSPSEPEPALFVRWHGMTLSRVTLERLQARAASMGRKPEDLAGECLDKAAEKWD